MLRLEKILEVIVLKKYDYHVHSHFSGDCETDVRDILEFGIKNHVDTICLTDHYDYDYPYDDVCFELDIDNYFPTLERLQETYKDRINLLIGIEVGVQPHIIDFLHKKLCQYPFDFIIASTHLIDKMDPYYKDFFTGKTQYEAYYRYFETILETVKTYKEYDVFGHLDYIIRYGNFENKSLSSFDYNDIIDEILKTIIDTSHGIEINTSGLRYGLNQAHPNEKILKRYRELGGEIITIGSDAHNAKDLCSYYDYAVDMLKNCGFKYLSIFQKRKPTLIKLDS